MAERPKYSIRAKSKKTGAKLYLAAFWENEKGNSGTLDREVEKIVLKSGAVIRPQDIYLDFFVNEEQDQRPEPKAEANEKNQAYQGDGEESMPF